jgi:hypothetical protein
MYNFMRDGRSRKVMRPRLSQEEASRQTASEGGTVPHFVTSSPKQDQVFYNRFSTIIMVVN